MVAAHSPAVLSPVLAAISQRSLSCFGPENVSLSILAAQVLANHSSVTKRPIFSRASSLLLTESDEPIEQALLCAKLHRVKWRGHAVTQRVRQLRFWQDTP